MATAESEKTYSYQLRVRSLDLVPARFERCSTHQRTGSANGG